MNENCYHLFYSGFVHPRIIEKDFESIYEIDLITTQSKDEKDFREKKSTDIARCQLALDNYIEGMKRRGVRGEKLNGEIYIVKNDQYIKPLYKSTKMTPLQLINSITDKLDKERDNNLLKNFISNFKGFFYTDFTRTRGFKKYNENIRKYPSRKVDSRLNEEDYQNLLSLINEALLYFYSKHTRSVDEEHLFLYRQMSDYIDNHIKARIKEEEKRIQIEKIVNTIENTHIETKRDSHNQEENDIMDSMAITFDDLPKIMEKYEDEEKQKVLNNPKHVNAKDIPRLLQEYKNEQVKNKQIIEEQRLKEDKEFVKKESNFNFYIDDNEQVAFTRTASSRDREELPDDYENEGHKYR